MGRIRIWKPSYNIGRYLPKTSAVITAFGIFYYRFTALFAPRDPSLHLTLPKVLKGLLGFIPVAVGSAYIGYSLANK